MQAQIVHHSLLFFRIIHDNGFTEDDLLRFKPVIYSNTIVSMVTMLRAMEKLRISFGDKIRAVRVVFLFIRSVIW